MKKKKKKPERNGGSGGDFFFFFVGCLSFKNSLSDFRRVYISPLLVR